MNARLTVSAASSQTATQSLAHTVLLAYRDPDHERMGKKYCELVANGCGWTGHTNLTEWKFEMLGCVGMDKMAAAEARQADLVVIATSSGEDLSAETRKWLASWCSRRRQTPGALVVLLSECPGFSEAHWPEYAFLQAQADKCGMKLIVYASGLAPEEGGSLCMAEARRVTSAGLLVTTDSAENAVLA